MDIILEALAIFIAAPLIIGPFVIKYVQWVNARADIRPVSLATLDRNVADFIGKAGIEFESLGFENVGFMELLNYMPKTSTYFGLFRNDQFKAAGMAAVIRHSSGRILKYYEFSNKYSNGRVINVNNSTMLGSYINPDKSSYRYPKVTSIKRLCEINSWVTGHDSRTANPVELVKGREIETLIESLNKEMRLQAQSGYCFLDENAARYRMTWKGAFIMTWRNAFPMKSIREFLDLRAAKKVIEGMPSQ